MQRARPRRFENIPLGSTTFLTKAECVPLLLLTLADEAHFRHRRSWRSRRRSRRRTTTRTWRMQSARPRRSRVFHDRLEYSRTFMTQAESVPFLLLTLADEAHFHKFNKQGPNEKEFSTGKFPVNKNLCPNKHEFLTDTGGTGNRVGAAKGRPSDLREAGSPSPYSS